MASALIVLGLAEQHRLRTLAELWPTKAPAARTPTHSWSSRRYQQAA